MAIKGDNSNTAQTLDVTNDDDMTSEELGEILNLPNAQNAKISASLSTDTYEVGDLLVSYLEQIDVEYVFGIPGGPIEPLYNALARSERRGGTKSIVARHETGAAFMADGYARNSGKIGVCCGTAGPGTTNLITGVASAFDNHTPMLVITAQTALENFGHGATQESGDTGINTVAMFSHCTRYSSLVSHIDQIEQKLASALMTAMRSPRGPVHLSIPLDVLRQTSPVNYPSYDLSNLLWQPSPVDLPSVEILYKELKEAENIVLIVGEECSEGIGNILNLAIALNARIVTTPHAKGLVSPYHPLYRGVIGFAGHESALDTLNDESVDLFLKIGTPLRETAACGWDIAIFNNRLIHVDSTEDNLMQSPMAKLHVRGDLTQIFEQLENRFNVPQLAVVDRDLTKDKQKILSRNFTVIEEKKCIDNAVPLKPQRLMTELPNIFPRNTKYLCDSGNSMAWSIHYLHPYDRRFAGYRDEYGGLLWTCLEFGSMGWAIGSSVGTSLANLERPVVCITGDGAMLMFGGEITVALQHKLPVFFVILNDSEYGMVRHGQNIGGAEHIGFELPTINFADYAKAMGIKSFIIKSIDDLESLDINTLMLDGPVVLDVHIDKTEVPPINNRLKALGNL